MFWKKEGRCVALMCLAAFLQGMVFYGPVASLYRTQAGLSMGDIALIESVYYLLVVALELPLGAAAARLGYKRMLAVCSAVFFLSKLVFWRAGSFGAFLAERVMLAFVGAGLSGCDTAYLYVAAGPKRAQRALGLYGAAGMAGLLAATAAFTLFFSASYRQAALATAVAYGLAALCTLALPAVPMQAEDRAAFSAQIRGMWRSLCAAPRYALMLAADALVDVTGQTVTVFLSQLAYVRCGLSGAQLGAAYLGMTLVGLMQGVSYKATRALGRRGFSIAVCMLMAAACGGLCFARGPLWCVACVWCVQLCWRLWQPFAQTMHNDSVRLGARSVVLSGYSMAQSLAMSGLNLGLGRLADAALPLAFAAAGAFCMLALVLAALYFRQNKKGCVS